MDRSRETLADAHRFGLDPVLFVSNSDAQQMPQDIEFIACRRRMGAKQAKTCCLTRYESPGVLAVVKLFAVFHPFQGVAVQVRVYAAGETELSLAAEDHSAGGLNRDQTRGMPVGH